MKHYEVFLEAPVTVELQAVVDYYEAKSDGLGERFRDAFYEQLNHVAVAPFARAICYDDIRFALLNRFAEAIHYWVDEQAAIVSVVGIVSQHRDPETTWVYGDRET